VASEQNLSLSLLRQFNPELSSWPSSEPLPTGTTLLLPVYRSTTPIPAGRSCWCRAICPLRRCRRGSGSTCRPGALLPCWMSCLSRSFEELATGRASAARTGRPQHHSRDG
jgi:hypothetical protein